MKPFSFSNPADLNSGPRNWIILQQGTKSRKQSGMTITGGVGTPTLTLSYFTLYGPIVFFNITLELANAEGWAAGATIPMPYAEAIDPTGTYVNPGLGVYHFNAVNQAGVVRDTAYLVTASVPTLLTLKTGYTNATGVAEAIGINGWYLRN